MSQEMIELTEMGYAPRSGGVRANEGQWFVASGMDAPTVVVHFCYEQRGRDLHAWARIVLPGGPPILLHATTDVAEIERQLKAHPRIQQQITASGGEAAIGWFGSKAFRKIKKAAKSIGISKVINTVRTLAKKAIHNPIISMALRATPYGQLALAINKGASIASAALHGNLKAKNALGFLVKQWKAGNPMAATALRFVRMGARQVRGMPAAVSGGDDVRAYLALGDLYGPGNNTIDVGDDVDALLSFASAGAFDGTRWLLDRMALRSMSANPQEFSKRDALMSGREVLATRFA